jgi:hypothetical protein
MKLFITGFLQVALVTFQTWIIAHNKLILIFPVGFMISFIWSFNIKKVCFGNMRDRIIYSTGAGTGAIISILLSNIFFKIIIF